MNISNIIQEIFQRFALEDVSLEELQTLTEEAPYFASAHFLLIKKMQQTKDADLEKQLQKAALFFENPLWLRYLVQNEDAVTENARYEPVTVAEPIKAAEPVIHAPSAQVEIAEAPREEQLVHTEAINEDSEVIDAHTQQTIVLEPEPPKPMVVIEPLQDDNRIFEPYHTIDYFASLGIKVGKNVPVNDKLGKQLKSFTEWLKTLKKLPEAAVASMQEPDDQPMPDKKVEAMAASSIKEKETLTESMAEVLLKQGKKETAIQMYNKLSLLNPDKSHYFAAKIEALKQN